MLVELLKKGVNGIDGTNHRCVLIRRWILEHDEGKWTDKKKNEIMKFLQKTIKNVLMKDLVCDTSVRAVWK